MYRVRRDDAKEQNLANKDTYITWPSSPARKQQELQDASHGNLGVLHLSDSSTTPHAHVLSATKWSSQSPRLLGAVDSTAHEIPTLLAFPSCRLTGHVCSSLRPRHTCVPHITHFKCFFVQYQLPNAVMRMILGSTLVSAAHVFSTSYLLF